MCATAAALGRLAAPAARSAPPGRRARRSCPPCRPSRPRPTRSGDDLAAVARGPPRRDPADGAGRPPPPTTPYSRSARRRRCCAPQHLRRPSRRLRRRGVVQRVHGGLRRVRRGLPESEPRRRHDRAVGDQPVGDRRGRRAERPVSASLTARGGLQPGRRPSCCRRPRTVTRRANAATSTGARRGDFGGPARVRDEDGRPSARQPPDGVCRRRALRRRARAGDDADAGRRAGRRAPRRPRRARPRPRVVGALQRPRREDRARRRRAAGRRARVLVDVLGRGAPAAARARPARARRRRSRVRDAAEHVGDGARAPAALFRLAHARPPRSARRRAHRARARGGCTRCTTPRARSS